MIFGKSSVGSKRIEDRTSRTTVKYAIRSAVLVAIAVPALAGGFACSGGNVDLPPDEPGPTATGEVPTFHKDIEPLVQAHCQSCHTPGKLAPFSLVTYDDAKRVAGLMARETSARRMPPWNAQETAECKPPHAWKGDARLTDAQIDLIARWKNGGSPEGDPKDAPPSRVEPKEGLALPDLEVAPKAPFVAGGDRDQFRCFAIDPKVVGPRFVSGVHVIPGNGKVVHHAVVVADMKRASLAKAGSDGSYECSGGDAFTKDQIVLDVWTPGVRPIELPETIGIPFPEGSSLMLQIHYSPGGETAAPDTTRVQLRFASRVPDYYLFTTGAGNAGVALPGGDGLQSDPDDRSGIPEFRIPAYASHHVERMQTTISSTTDTGAAMPPLYVYGLMAHEHLAGIDVKVDLQRGDATTCLLQDRWDFHWQRMYAYDAPIGSLPMLLPGDKLKLRCTYDNTMDNRRLSAELIARKRPIQDVTLGEQTLDEMCLVVAQVLVKRP